MDSENYYSNIDFVKKALVILLAVSIIVNFFLLIKNINQKKIIESTEQMLEEQKKRINNFINNTDEVNENKTIFVHLSGAIDKPGVYSFSNPVRLFELIEEAGGEQAEADLSSLNLAEAIFDGSKIYIPKKGEVVSQTVLSATEGSKLSKKININTATLEQLQSLDGIGKVKAKEIIAYREKNGSFKKVEDIILVKGIGESTYDKIKSMIIVK